MFITSIDYEQTLRTVVAEDGELLLAVAFWGRGAESVVLSRPKRKLRLICNLHSGASNPDTIDTLRCEKGVDVRQHDRLHAKVIIGSYTALVGSANLSSNGLNLEAEEVEGWEEAGIVVQDPHSLGEIRAWFESLWNKARQISDEDVRNAKLRWAQRRSTRIKSRSAIQQTGFTLQGLSQSDLLERPVYLAIYNSFLSEEAKAAYRKKHKELTGQPASDRSIKLPPMYEGWSQLPKDAHLIDLYYGPRGALRCYGVFIRAFDITFKYKDGMSGHLAICRKENELLSQRFRSQDAALLAKSLKPYIAGIWNSPKAKGDESGKVISLADAVQLCG